MVEELLKAGRAAVPGRDLLARARHRHGRRRPRAAGRVAEVGRARAAAHRPRRARRRRDVARGASSPSSAPTCSSARSSPSACARARSSRPSCRATRSTCSPSRSSRSPPRRARGRSCVDELHALVTRTYSYAELSRELLENVLDMLDGRYPSRGVRRAAPAHRVGPRRRARSARARARASSRSPTPARSPTAACTASYLPDGRRVGELDEEMVYEARPGQVFLLGASTWRIEEIGARPRDRHARARRARARCRSGRATASGARRSSARRSARSRAGRSSRTRRRCSSATTTSTSCAARNLVDYLREQQDATRVVPSDRTIVVERFRDEIGDWRLCVLSPVRRPRARRVGPRAVARASASEYGLESDAIWSDDGIIVHLPDADEPPGADLVLLDPDELEDARRRRARRQRAVRRALPRERRARAADPARLPRQAHAAVAAAAEVAVAARGRASATRSSRSCSRPTASACATCSTCPA